MCFLLICIIEFELTEDNYLYLHVVNSEVIALYHFDVFVLCTSSAVFKGICMHKLMRTALTRDVWGGARQHHAC